jgi:hypothetical protein
MSIPFSISRDAPGRRTTFKSHAKGLFERPPMAPAREALQQIPYAAVLRLYNLGASNPTAKGDRE